MTFLIDFIIIFPIVFIINLIGEKIIVNQPLTRETVFKNLLICLIISIPITSFLFF